MKAVVKNGAILLKEPLPKDWPDGTELDVAKANAAEIDADDLEAWMARVQASADAADPDDELILEKAIRNAREQARALARREAEKTDGDLSP